VSGCFKYHAENAEKLDGKQGNTVDVGMAEFDVKLFYEPVGVVGAITPWNYPALMATWKVAAALAAGCSVVLKPSELTPFTCVDMAVIACRDAGLPKGVWNVVTGDGPSAGGPLTVHPDVDKVAFTGSVATGQRIMKACADGVRNVSLELGGKSPILVFDDADIDSAVEWLMFGIFWTNGQICSATSRAIIHQDIAPRVIAKLKEVSERVVMCDPLTPPQNGKAYMGPVVSRAQRDKVVAYIESAKQEGAQVLTGGGPPSGCTKGFYIAPTVLTGVEPHMKVDPNRPSYLAPCPSFSPHFLIKNSSSLLLFTSSPKIISSSLSAYFFLKTCLLYPKS
jgi:betaine-aldehyde dehydrogenase